MRPWEHSDLAKRTAAAPFFPPQLPPHGLPPGGMPALPGSPGESGEQASSLWTMIDDRMRGRWVWAILLGIVLSGTLGTLGYLSGSPQYRSVGAIRITTDRPALLHQTEFHYLHNYEMKRSSEINILKSERVVRHATTKPPLAELEWSKRPGVVGEIRANLEVERDRESEMIYIWFSSDEPVVAHAVTNAVLAAYEEIYGNSDGRNMSSMIRDLKDHEGQIERQLSTVQAERRQMDSRYGTSDPRLLQESNMQLMASLRLQIRAAQWELDRMARSASQDSPNFDENLIDLPSLEASNPMLALRRNEWTEAQLALDNAKARYTPDSRVLQMAQSRAESTKKRYDDEYQKTLREWQKSGSKVVMAAGKTLTADDIAALQAEFDQLAEQQRRLVNDMNKREDLLREENAMQARLESIRNRIDTLELESRHLGGFITVADHGSMPEKPYENPSRKRAILGAGLGFVMSFGGFFLLGAIDRRTFGASQLGPKPGSRVPACLGVLPDLNATLSGSETADVAAHCVHQIRNQIEALRDPKRGYVLAVSSPFQGDGKTSICMALGWSYAAAGYNTLLIDCDLVGRSLTRQMGLVGREGMKDALALRELNGSVSRMAVDNLSAVPAGIDPAFGPENVRTVDLQHLLDQVRDQFDIILIDTGPMLGSLESVPVTSVADGVLLSVRRGRSRTRLEECIQRLELMGANCLGVVLNCAYRSDCYRYVSEASLAAAEDERAAHAGEATIVHATTAERNALINAMQNSNRLHRTSR